MRDRDGFTLIELLIVVVIIGILAAIAIPKFSSTREKAYFAAMKSDLKNLASQQEIYYSDTFEYTNVVVSLSFVSSSGVSATIIGGTDGWSATATHAALAATDGCAIYYGNAAAVTLGTAVPTGPGDMACTQ
jgi:prepilin-type N-terminal cleavage/methylation domain-containing protein